MTWQLVLPRASDTRESERIYINQKQCTLQEAMSNASTQILVCKYLSSLKGTKFPSLMAKIIQYKYINYIKGNLRPFLVGMTTDSFVSYHSFTFYVKFILD